LWYFAAFFNATTASNTPRTMLKKAANNTLNSSGSRKVMVWAGILTKCNACRCILWQKQKGTKNDINEAKNHGRKKKITPFE